jgi:hypothetical protein
MFSKLNLKKFRKWKNGDRKKKPEVGREKFMIHTMCRNQAQTSP